MAPACPLNGTAGLIRVLKQVRYHWASATGTVTGTDSRATKIEQAWIGIAKVTITYN